MTIAALFVEAGGCYFDLAGVEPWPAYKDARRYAGPHPVVAHPPCQRWGRFWHGSTRKPHQYQLGDDGGCCKAAVNAVRTWGGVFEHPADSHAFRHFGLPIPKRGEGWTEPDEFGGRSCYVEQGHYGHSSRKPTWLYACRVRFPVLNWSRGEQRIPQWMLDRYGYEKARRIGVVAMVGGKNKTRIRNATPLPFRDLLLSIARSAHSAPTWTPCGADGRGIFVQPDASAVSQSLDDAGREHTDALASPCSLRLHASENARVQP